MPATSAVTTPEYSSGSGSSSAPRSTTGSSPVTATPGRTNQANPVPGAGRTDRSYVPSSAPNWKDPFWSTWVLPARGTTGRGSMSGSTTRLAGDATALTV